jgi:hypothetical protein
MVLTGWMVLELVFMLLLFAAVYVCVRHLLHALLPEGRPFPFARIRELLAKQRRYRVLRSMFLVPRHESGLEEIRHLIASCGWTIDAVSYTAVKRFIVSLCVLLIVVVYAGWHFGWVEDAAVIWVVLVCGTVTVIASFDKSIMRTVREQRRAKIVHDVHVISSQLLYYRKSRLNVHGQLQRCVPLATYIRKELQLLVNEWYEGSGEAIRKFRDRLATDEAADFAETLYALHLYGGDRYYELLEERIRSYKEKLALIRDSRKEATSYVLFLLSGIPIMYTFLIFIYPWIAESRRLFDMLN